jgi:hypothetical protein
VKVSFSDTAALTPLPSLDFPVTIHTNPVVLAARLRGVSTSTLLLKPSAFGE